MRGVKTIKHTHTQQQAPLNINVPKALEILNKRFIETHFLFNKKLISNKNKPLLSQGFCHLFVSGRGASLQRDFFPSNQAGAASVVLCSTLTLPNFVGPRPGGFGEKRFFPTPVPRNQQQRFYIFFSIFFFSVQSVPPTAAKKCTPYSDYDGTLK